VPQLERARLTSDLEQLRAQQARLRVAQNRFTCQHHARQRRGQSSSIRGSISPAHALAPRRASHGRSNAVNTTEHLFTATSSGDGRGTDDPPARMSSPRIETLDVGSARSAPTQGPVVDATKHGSETFHRALDPDFRTRLRIFEGGLRTVVERALAGS